VGRLSSEKGIPVMLDAWRHLSGTPLKVVGDGPLRDADWPNGVTWLGHQTREQVLTLMRGASMLIFPSVCPEPFGLAIVESLACGTPVIASDIGAVPELVANGRTGFLFRPGDASDLADKVRSALGNPHGLQRMRTAARREFEEKYTAERNYEMLMAIYGRAIENANARRRAAS
jgi:glycosyltransferase involved in cell wall biosynthesis